MIELASVIRDLRQESEQAAIRPFVSGRAGGNQR